MASSSNTSISPDVAPFWGILNPDPISYAPPGVDPMMHSWRFYRRHPVPVLPEGWEMEIRVRQGGKTPGTTYKIYYEPGTGKSFKSFKAVMEYLRNK